MQKDFKFNPIGIVHSPFKEKFGIPRQPGLAPSAKAVIELLPPFNLAETVLGLPEFSHIWVIFIFHATSERGWSPTVRPPRLGGNKRTGVFATRSTHRPNPIGMSVAELEQVEVENGKVLLHLRNIDLMDGTPVIDIKPYVPYSDSIPNAYADYAANVPEHKLIVSFNEEVEIKLREKPQLKQLIIEILRLDPRPAYRSIKDDANVYGIRIEDVDVKFKIENNAVIVVDL
ncbi:tRNA (N6-threonylcarbamoyladenosine(37)-N6)-methyltransferase TrmO [Solitalea koreensis]|nr:tRNA (N6-threonylcarbamoyladenosine(37)-N6)-methyltransferase TrmO [Solitalea koreensis]